MLVGAAAWAAAGFGAGCTGDMFDIEIGLAATSLGHDFGRSAPAIPALSCRDDRSCAGFQAPPVPDQRLRFACDLAVGRCYGETDVRITAPIEVVQEGSLGAESARQIVRFIRSIDLAYTIPVNSLTFAVPRMDVYVSAVPAGQAPPAVGDAPPMGAVLIDSITPVAAAQTVASARHLRIAKGTPAHATIESGMRGEGALIFSLVMRPRFPAGAPPPAGKIEVVLQPTVRVGVPWSELLP
jgi:hypothetical protein